MFSKESDMTSSAVGWMKSCGLTVKMEFIAPWGICDLVGVTLNPGRVEHRLKLKQTRPIGSVRRSALLLSIPDVETRKSTTLDKLLASHATDFFKDEIANDVEALIADRFIVRTSRGRLQKMNGWMPLYDRLVAVELKRFRIEEAMRQAFNNFGFTQESYVGLPADVAKRVDNNPTRWAHFFEAGVGLLSVAPNECTILRASSGKPTTADAALQLYSVEKFWRTRLKDSSSSMLLR